MGLWLVLLCYVVPPRTYDKPRIKKQIEFDNERDFEVERRCLFDMNLASRILSWRPDYNYSMEELKLCEGFALNFLFIIILFVYILSNFFTRFYV